MKIGDLVKPNYETNIMGIVVSEVNNLIGDPEDFSSPESVVRVKWLNWSPPEPDEEWYACNFLEVISESRRLG